MPNKSSKNKFYTTDPKGKLSKIHDRGKGRGCGKGTLNSNNRFCQDMMSKKFLANTTFQGGTCSDGRKTVVSAKKAAVGPQMANWKQYCIQRL